MAAALFPQKISVPSSLGMSSGCRCHQGAGNQDWSRHRGIRMGWDAEGHQEGFSHLKTGFKGAVKDAVKK